MVRLAVSYDTITYRADGGMWLAPLAMTDVTARGAHRRISLAQLPVSVAGATMSTWPPRGTACSAAKMLWIVFPSPMSSANSAE